MHITGLEKSKAEASFIVKIHGRQGAIHKDLSIISNIFCNEYGKPGGSKSS